MIDVQPLSQRDSRWKLKKLGFGSGSIGSYGCTITALTMLLNSQGENLPPDQVNERLKDANAFAGDTKNLLWWDRIRLAFPQTQQPTQYWEYDNAKVKSIIDSGRPVIVKVDGAPIGAESHWVLYLGGGKMADPWYGDITSTSRYTPLRFVDIPIQKDSNMGKISVDTALYEKLVTNSTAKKDVANYLKKKGYSITSDPDDAPAEEILGVVRGIETAVTTATSRVRELETEVKNQKEKLANREEVCQNDIKTIRAELTTQKELVKLKDKELGAVGGQLKDCQKALKEEQKQGGLKNIEIEKLKTKVKQLQSDVSIELSFWDLILLKIKRVMYE